MNMKVKGFLKDISGASRIVKIRKEKINEADERPETQDSINDIAKKLHPNSLRLCVREVRQISSTTRSYELVAKEGSPSLPVFQAGQYASFRFKIGNSNLTRPYSISSAPFESRKDDPYISITVRCKGEGFVQNYIYDNWKVGTEVEASMPHGQFYYEALRDAKNVVALAGGSGITPFYSMAKEIVYGKLDFNLTIIYGSAVKDDIILYEDLNKLAKSSNKIKVVHVLSDEKGEWDGERGFLSAEIIKKYSDPKNTSYFICGPQVMYKFIDAELKKLHIPRRRIRKESFGAPRDIKSYKTYPGNVNENYKLTVIQGTSKKLIYGNSFEPVAVALERNNIKVDTKCRSGECGFCRSELISGSIFVPDEDDGRRIADREFGYIHPCSTYALSDLTIRIPIIK